MSLDFSDDGRFPATIEVVLGNGYRYKQSATDDEARELIAELGTGLCVLPPTVKGCPDAR